MSSAPEEIRLCRENVYWPQTPHIPFYCCRCLYCCLSLGGKDAAAAGAAVQRDDLRVEMA